MMPEIECTEVAFVANEGRATMRIPKEGWDVVSNWLAANGKTPEETVRNYAPQPDGSVQFQCGTGYAVVDEDVLGGDGTGRTERRFNDETGYYLVKAAK